MDKTEQIARIRRYQDKMSEIRGYRLTWREAANSVGCAIWAEEADMGQTDTNDPEGDECDN